ncbi:MAG: EAL domain-containing protein [Cocleimonas sp.]
MMDYKNKIQATLSGMMDSGVQLFMSVLLGMVLIAGTYHLFNNENSSNIEVSNESIHTIIYSDDYTVALTSQEQQWIDQNPIIQLGIDRAFPPFSSISNDNKYIGFSADYIRLIEHRTGLKFHIEKDASWGETMELAILGKLDILVGLVKTTERQQFLDFTDSYIKRNTVIINVGKKHGFIGSLKYLNNKKIVVEKGSFSATELLKKYPEIELLYVDNTTEALKQVSIGNADAYVGNAEVARKIIQDDGYYNLSFSADTEFFSRHSMGIVKPNNILLSIMDKTLQSISAGNKTSLVNYWFGLNTKHFLPKKVVFLIGSFLLGVLVLLLIWTYSLRKTKNALKESKKKLQLQSEVDDLTGLGNRRGFYKRLKKVIENADESVQSFTLFFLDLDMFKEVNDTHGHEVGDLLLIEVAKRLKASVVGKGSVSRLGGDEFVIIIPGLFDKVQIKKVAVQIRSNLSYPYIIKRHEVSITTSIGITRYPEDAENSKTLVMNGDQAMYYSKNNGRNCFSYFNKVLQNESLHKSTLIKDLRVAVYERQFSLHFQPIIELSSNKITKAEALIRWEHPTRGLISPVEFIPLAEQAGLINAIGEWVFKEAMDQTVKILESYDKDFQMTVNTSPLQYEKNGMDVKAWGEYLKSCGLSGKNVLLEITEGLLMEMNESVIKNLFHLRDLSISVAIDDFGTGYSTLSYLKKYDIDYLKIDQSFVSNLTPESDDHILVQAIIDMSARLGVKIVAEGVEKEEQRDILRDAGCDFAQGYYYSEPLNGEDFMALLQNWNKKPEKAVISSDLPILK